jgi:hypothetical protein
MQDTFIDLFKTDDDLAKNGVKIEVGYNSQNKPVILTVAEAGNPKHEAVQRRYAKALENTRRNPDRHRAVLCKVVAESILLDWDGVLDEDGNERECTLENRIEALITYKKLFYAVMDAAADEGNFKLQPDELSPEEVEEDTKGN